MQCMATAAAACGPYRSGVGVWGSPRIGEQCAPRGRPLGKLHGQSVRGLRGPHRHRDRRGWWRRRVVLPIAAQQAAQRMGATVFIGLRLPAAMALRADVRGPRWQLCLGHYRQRREAHAAAMRRPARRKSTAVVCRVWACCISPCLRVVVRCWMGALSRTFQSACSTRGAATTLR